MTDIKRLSLHPHHCIPRKCRHLSTLRAITIATDTDLPYGVRMIARWHGAVALVLASNVLMFGFFLVTTRMHERYLFPIPGLGLLLAVLDARYWRYVIGMNVLVFANIGLRYAWPLNDAWTGWQYAAGFGWLERPVTVWFMVLATGMAFVYLLLQLFTKPLPVRRVIHVRVLTAMHESCGTVRPRRVYGLGDTLRRAYHENDRDFGRGAVRLLSRRGVQNERVVTP